MPSRLASCRKWKEMTEDWSLNAYDYLLPQEAIAQTPAARRGDSRLMLLDRLSNDNPKTAIFHDLPRYLPEGSLLIANNTRVVPARLSGKRPCGGKLEFLLLTPLPVILGNARKNGQATDGENCAMVEALLKPAAKIPIGSDISLGNGLKAKILAKREFGRCEAILCWQGNLEALLFAAGQSPLPPYIRRNADSVDKERYQTVYASCPGAIAAPTAGLHFDNELRKELASKGCQWAEITLHTGYGTFSPVRCEDIRQHHMHSEYVEIRPETVEMINNAKAQKRPVIAIGTTSARACEGVMALKGKMAPFTGWIDLFITPGFTFQAIQGLITNFHLPKSSLLMLVSAFAGRKRILNAYAQALSQGFRFFSYGDAMLII